MKFSCHLVHILVLIVTPLYIFSQADAIGNSFSPPAHPRILMFKEDEATVKKMIKTDPAWAKTHQIIIEESDKLLSTPTLERKQIGRRLLSVSREAIRRLFFLSYAYRLTEQREYLKRAEQEMLTISAFTDWNPSHFLDVAEMTMAMAIGYDWLFNNLSPESRTIIKDAITKKGIEPSLESKYNSWLKAEHNWNQVCNAGMSYGAMAIYEDNPELAKKIINRSIETIVFAMADYGPDGGYPEGYGYWGYGTSFNVMFNSAIEKLFGKDFGLNEKPGFLKTAGFLENMTGPSGQCFNYSDSGPGSGLQPAMFWFAQKTKNVSLLWVEKNYLLNGDANSNGQNRLLPAVMLWGIGVPIHEITAPKETMWVSQGKNPVALMRTSWTDPSAIYLAAKGGSVSVNHAHMDIGSFIMEADGEKWAMDFGMQQYESLESKGIQLFGRTQDAQRWTVFRYTNLVHNTLTVNGQHQRVVGFAPITSSSATPSFMNATIDMTEVYKGAVTKANRGVAIIDQKYVMVQDEVEALDTATTIRWTMLTPADVIITGKNTAELTKNGKKLKLEVISPAKVNMKTWSTDPPNSYDAPNPGTIMVGFEVSIPAKSKTTLTVSLIPQSSGIKKAKKLGKLESWNKK